ncbi:MAG TPA: L-seryl-tRNA(Sec) selenium transferase [Phycisphaerae bacterium]|nr:L-seryl-tRNA(Sec) selenium transferase [Phycisphaerae bacterium]
MTSSAKQDLLRKLPSVDKLLASADVADWLEHHPRALVVQCLRDALEELRGHIVSDTGGRCGARHVTGEFVLAEAARHLDRRTRPHLRGAINATGILLHTGLGRSVWPESVVDSMVEELKGYVTLAVDRETGKRSDRDRRVEYILAELTGAEAATVVNNNAAATMLVLAALAAGRETIVSRGQLIEIGGAFRLPDVMAQSGSRLVEVGTTNRTHLADYESAITDATAVIMRVHPSNFRVVGFTKEVPLAELVELAHARGLVLFDDLGAGAIVDLARFGLPHEPTLQESIAAGADVVIASADKLIGAGQGGIIVGRSSLVERIRKHPLARAFRVDKACLMVLERTLHLFRDPDRLAREHPLYRALATSTEALEGRARELAAAIGRSAPAARAEVVEGVGYLGSGSLPTEQLPTRLVAVVVEGLGAEELARRLRTDEACVFARIENDRVVLDVRTIREKELPAVADAMGRVAQ